MLLTRRTRQTHEIQNSKKNRSPPPWAPNTHTDTASRLDSGVCTLYCTLHAIAVRRKKSKHAHCRLIRRRKDAEMGLFYLFVFAGESKIKSLQKFRKAAKVESAGTVGSAGKERGEKVHMMGIGRILNRCSPAHCGFLGVRPRATYQILIVDDPTATGDRPESPHLGPSAVRASFSHQHAHHAPFTGQTRTSKSIPFVLSHKTLCLSLSLCARSHPPIVSTELSLPG